MPGLEAILVTIAALLPIVNPLGSAPIGGLRAELVLPGV